MAIPLILCGGSGTRLWPLSRPHHPKPFLRLLGKYSLFQHTLQRCRAFEAPLIICHASHLSLVQEQCAEIGITPRGILLEPQPRGTAAAVAAACLALKSTFSDHPLLLLPADLVINDQSAFDHDLRRAIANSQRCSIVIFGISPTHPQPRFGYMEAGEKLDDNSQQDVFTIRRFIGKPTVLDDVTQDTQKYFWNSGMFVITLAKLHAALQKRQPQLMQIVAQALRDGDKSTDKSTFIHTLHPANFGRAPQLSFEMAVQQEFADGIMQQAHFDWNDAGTWNALWQLQATSADANVTHGKARVRDARRCYVHATTKRISVQGCDDLVVVETEDEIFITTRQTAEEMEIISD